MDDRLSQFVFEVYGGDKEEIERVLEELKTSNKIQSYKYKHKHFVGRMNLHNVGSNCKINGLQQQKNFMTNAIGCDINQDNRFRGVR